MKLPIPLFLKQPTFQPRKHLGQDPNLSDWELDVINEFDVKEQHLEWATFWIRLTWTLAALTGLGLIVTQGPKLWNVIKGVAAFFAR